MAAGLYLTPEQIRKLPIRMQEQICLGIAAQLAQAASVAEREKKKGRGFDAEMRSEGICKVPIQRDMCCTGTDRV